MKHFPTFLAFDLETANARTGSICSIAFVVIENGKVKHFHSDLIKPETPICAPFTKIHGITNAMVYRAIDFDSYWKQARTYFNQVDFICAHNVSFDKRHLFFYEELDIPFLCTMKLANEIWQIPDKKLTTVAQFLGIDHGTHHNASDDAYTCAQIMIEILKDETFDLSTVLNR